MTKIIAIFVGRIFMMETTLDIAFIETPLGTMTAGATRRGVCLLGYADGRHLELELRQLSRALGASPIKSDNPHLTMLRRQLEEYFRGERREFDIPLDIVGTPFQKEVWLGLSRIPYGCMVSYAQQAAALGRPSSVRAVANANGKNKISIVLPCHRVIGADGTLTGYGGGIERKRKLLELEAKYIKP